MEISTIATMVVSALHVGFFILESVLWTSPPVTRLFDTTVEDANTTKVLALNQGFYNLGVAGLLIGFVLTDNEMGVLGMLAFVVVMGIVGAVTANWRIFLVQSLPALLTIWLVSTL